MYTPKHRLKQLIWRFHLSDADDQISIPHGHCIDSDKKNRVLNPYTGEIYIDKKRSNDKISKKELKTLWEDKDFL